MRATVYTIPTNSDYYGAETAPEDALQMARWMRAQLELQYPAVEFKLVAERMSANNGARGDEELIEAIRRTEERLWMESDW